VVQPRDPEAQTLMLWNRGIARSSLMGSERTHNPSPAAASLIGKARTKRASKIYYGKRASRRAYKGNPVPALLLGLAPKLGLKVFGGPDAAKQKLRIEKLNDYAYQVVNVKGIAGQQALAELQAVANRLEGHGVAINDETVGHARELLKSIQMAATPPGKTVAQSALGVLQTPGLAQAIPGIIAATQPKQSYNKFGQLTQKVFQGYSPTTGKPKYKNVVVGAAGTAAGLAPGLGGAGAAAGGIGLGGAALAVGAGAGAYLVTNLLLKNLGGRALSKEQAGVQAAIAHRQALQAYPKEQAAINAAYKSTLIELGYDPVTFTRKRTGVEQFLSDYNPFD
jgi:hypothetical protein